VTVTAQAADALAITLTAPIDGTKVATGSTVTLTATLAHASSSVYVEFYDGTTKLGTDSASPWSFTWPNVAAGAHRLTARVVDYGGLAAVSQLVTITAATDSGTPPRAIITSPTASATTNASVESSFTVTGTADTVNPAASIASWTLQRADVDGTHALVVASGTMAVTAGTLATVDTTTWPNDVYDLWLTVTDTLGRSSQTSVAVRTARRRQRRTTALPSPRRRRINSSGSRRISTRRGASWRT
jgi:hypothetical protein